MLCAFVVGMKHVKGILLFGPPGTGKTLMARYNTCSVKKIPRIIAFDKENSLSLVRFLYIIPLFYRKKSRFDEMEKSTLVELVLFCTFTYPYMLEHVFITHSFAL